MTDDERFNELETKVAYQDDLLDSLNRTLANQQQEIMDLRHLCRQLLQQLRDMRERAPALQADRPEDNIPPHY